MKVIADLQLHSKYSRAVSPQMVIPHIREWAKRKGIGLVATGDWTHPMWMREIKTNLEEMGNGLLKLKGSAVRDQGSESVGEEPLFLLATEVSCIYSQGGKQRRIHTLIWAPSIASAEKINRTLVARGANLMSDGRPIVGLTSIQIADIVLSIDPTCMIIPAHAWTPWFSLYGSESGFDSIDECFGQYAKDIYAIETGLSSDPAMNWRIKELDERTILSFSDAHSGPKLGREVTVFELPELSYSSIRDAIRTSTTNFSRSTDTGGNGSLGHSGKAVLIEAISASSEIVDARPSHASVSYTIEFYPEEGKYHFTGHRNCGIKQMPKETKTKGTICPVCGKKLTVGVMHRVEDLAGRSEESLQLSKKPVPGTVVEGTYSQVCPNRPPYVRMVPLLEIIAEGMRVPAGSKRATEEYFRLTDHFGGEFPILLSTPVTDITGIAGERIAQAVDKVRKEDIFIDPGYDGVFGVVKIWGNAEEAEKDEKKDQLSLF